MRRISLLSLTALFVIATSSDAQAMPRIAYELMNYKEHVRPLHLFFAFCFFAVMFIFGRYQEWRTSITLGSAMMAGLSIGVCIVWAITGDFFKGHANKFDTDRQKPAQVVVATNPTEVAPGSGEKCKTAADCSNGTTCASVAGKKKCWQPCGADGTCPASFACFPVSTNLRVCAR